MRRLTPYLLALPSWMWLAIFLVVPLAAMASVSLQTGNVIDGFVMTFSFSNYGDAISAYGTQFARSLLYGGLATAAMLVIGYPVAYWIAFKGGSRKSMYLFLLLLPFFVSFVLRTISWGFLLSDDGILFGTLKGWGLLPPDFHVLATAFAVVAGLTYNWLPFMILPIYVSLERVDPRVVEAAQDLYATRSAAFRKVVLPLSLPGVFAGVLMTFVPATADPINAQVLGGTGNTMIGNIIQTEYLVNNDYPTASALSFTLMAVLLVGIFIYARVLGTENVLEAAAR
ncbi:ABC transporter permease [Nonomuraea glycinis]|jgi:spermidine/putrescine transport system permease protein|uniref:ABC transporter permease n=1 Tax=Nonomuraea glycinis TaxID=2047744 RepID=A0A918A3F5_9ACTN|nr:ABC transporter permease [Nonomuraea glycinis]MCA2183292.1 ABC transporter permease [Nonomuraea glycinis]WSG63801.1 ABC transporter permease [Nonomuraea glycinis]GGP04455.1 ABC transporter permease [Nonomuraea glycinis]